MNGFTYLRKIPTFFDSPQVIHLQIQGPVSIKCTTTYIKHKLCTFLTKSNYISCDSQNKYLITSQLDTQESVCLTEKEHIL